jgi:hypothetical protein
LPGKDKPHSTYATLDEWQDAYETFSAKLAANTKIEPRDRMTKLRELREVNQKTIDSVEGTKKIRHISGHQQRIQALAATQTKMRRLPWR